MHACVPARREYWWRHKVAGGTGQAAAGRLSFWGRRRPCGCPLPNLCSRIRFHKCVPCVSPPTLHASTPIRTPTISTPTPPHPTPGRFLSESAENYVGVAAEHLQETSRSLQDIARDKGLLA